MRYRILYSRFIVTQGGASLVEDDVEADGFEISEMGALTLYQIVPALGELKPQRKPVLGLPAGAWIMIEKDDYNPDKREILATQGPPPQAPGPRGVVR